jgi:predicted amidohydrolase YtcJ
MTARVARVATAAAALALVAACARRDDATSAPADLVVLNGRVYTLAWSEPDAEGKPAADAPYDSAGGWHPDAQAVVIRDGRVIFAGDGSAAMRFAGQSTRILDAQGATVLPGLIDAHTHVANLGDALARVDLVGVATEADAVDRVAKRAATTPPGEWIVGYGWDEGAWANHYPDLRLLSERVPNHPVYLRGLHSFAGWANRAALERAHITRDTRAPTGGAIRTDAAGNPNGIFVDNATALIEQAIPPADSAEQDRRIISALQTMAAAGYVEVHEAGAATDLMAALERLAAAKKLPIRVYAMVAARDTALARRWLARGPDSTADGMLRVRSVKAFYDGALGSRGASLIEDYADRPGHRGSAGREYGFDNALVGAMARRGFQVAVHAIGDAANRGTLDFFKAIETETPAVRDGRHRIEHAQVLRPGDMPRFAELGIIASMQPSHAVEDKAWAEQRLGPTRVRGAYAWRTLRRNGARLVFDSDLPGTSYDIFYGLHSAMTRRDKENQPPGGWYPAERLAPEEAVRAFTTWAAYSAFEEGTTGVIRPGARGDLTLLSIDPFVVGTTNPDALLGGRVVATVAGGRVLYEKR